MSLSEPRVLVLGGNPGRWKAVEHRQQGKLINGVEAWVFAFDGEYCCNGLFQPSDFANYDIIIGNLNASFLAHQRKCLESKPDSVQWVSLVEGSATDYLRPDTIVRDILNMADLVNVINRLSLDFFRALTTTRVEYIGIPHPSEQIRAVATPMEKRRREAFLAAVLSSRQTEMLVAKQLDIPIVGSEPRLSRRLKTLPTMLKRYRTLDPYYRINKVKNYYAEEKLTVLREKPFELYFGYYGGSYMWINMDERYTWGRNVLDAAALQVPIISTVSTGHQSELFPELMVQHPFAIAEAISLGKRLIEDQEFYRSVSQVPLEKLASFSHSAMAKKLLNKLSS